MQGSLTKRKLKIICAGCIVLVASVVLWKYLVAPVLNTWLDANLHTATTTLRSNQKTLHISVRSRVPGFVIDNFNQTRASEFFAFLEYQPEQEAWQFLDPTPYHPTTIAVVFDDIANYTSDKPLFLSAIDAATNTTLKGMTSAYDPATQTMQYTIYFAPFSATPQEYAEFATREFLLLFFHLKHQTPTPEQLQELTTYRQQQFPSQAPQLITTKQSGVWIPVGLQLALQLHTRLILGMPPSTVTASGCAGFVECAVQTELWQCPIFGDSCDGNERCLSNPLVHCVAQTTCQGVPPAVNCNAHPYSPPNCSAVNTVICGGMGGCSIPGAPQQYGSCSNPSGTPPPTEWGGSVAVG